MSCKSCPYQENFYKFQTTKLNLNKSQRKCEENGGNLAKRLDEQAYIQLHKCCHDGNHYRIGLIADKKCSDTTPFRWIGEYLCKDASPWQNVKPSHNCQTISIPLLNHDNGKLQAPRLDKCTTRQNYICQYPQETTTPATTKMTNTNTTTKNPITSTSRTEKAWSPTLAARTTRLTSIQTNTTPATSALEISTSETTWSSTTAAVTAVSIATKNPTSPTAKTSTSTSETVTPSTATSKTATNLPTIAAIPTITSPISFATALLTSTSDVEENHIGTVVIAGIAVTALIIGFLILISILYCYKTKKQQNKPRKEMEMKKAPKHSVLSNEAEESVKNPIFSEFEGNLARNSSVEENQARTSELDPYSLADDVLEAARNVSATYSPSNDTVSAETRVIVEQDDPYSFANPVPVNAANKEITINQTYVDGSIYQESEEVPTTSQNKYEAIKASSFSKNGESNFEQLSLHFNENSFEKSENGSSVLRNSIQSTDDLPLTSNHNEETTEL